MSTQTLSQRLRDLRHGLFPDAATVNAVLDECIAQAEAMEGQAMPTNQQLDRALETMPDYNKRLGQAIDEQTPVAWMKRDTTSDMLPESALDLVMEQDAAAYIRKTWTPLYRSPISPEARDRAIEAGNAMRHWGERMSEEAARVACGYPVLEPLNTATAAFKKRVEVWDQALSALRANPTGD